MHRQCPYHLAIQNTLEKATTLLADATVCTDRLPRFGISNELGDLMIFAWLQRLQGQMPSQCGRGWQLWYSDLHAEILRRPLPEQRLAVMQVTYNGLGDRLASIVSVFWFAALTGLPLLSSYNPVDTFSPSHHSCHFTCVRYSYIQSARAGFLKAPNDVPDASADVGSVLCITL